MGFLEQRQTWLKIVIEEGGILTCHTLLGFALHLGVVPTTEDMARPFTGSMVGGRTAAASRSPATLQTEIRVTLEPPATALIVHAQATPSVVSVRSQASPARARPRLLVTPAAVRALTPPTRPPAALLEHTRDFSRWAWKIERKCVMICRWHDEKVWTCKTMAPFPGVWLAEAKSALLKVKKIKTSLHVFTGTLYGKRSEMSSGLTLFLHS